MFDDHNMEFDSMIKSILDSGQETVPSSVWDGVSSSLDKIDKRRKSLMIFRRSAIGAAAAACLALGLVFGHRQDSPVPIGTDSTVNELIAVVPPASSIEKDIHPDMIAMAEPEVITKAEDAVHTSASEFDRDDRTCASTGKVSDVREVTDIHTEVTVHETITPNKTTEEANMEEAIEKKSSYAISTEPMSDTSEAEYPDSEEFPDVWKDDTPVKKIRTSIELSGLAATNNAQRKKGSNIMKRPTLPSGKEKTGITDNSTNSTFGIPVSFGAAVKVDFTPRWSLSVGARYTLLTRKFYGTYTKVDENGIVEMSESSNIRNSQHFVGIPINAYFNIISKDFLKFYVYGGGAFEKCVADKYQLLNSGLTHTEKVQNLQWSVNAGLGVEFSAGKHLGIYIDPSLRYYFRNDSQPKSLRTVKPLMLGFEAGLRVRL